MKKIAHALAVVSLSLASIGVAHAETAIGAQFGYPGNIGLSLRFDRTPIGVAWSSDFLHGTADRWLKKQKAGDKLDWYYGLGVDAGIPLDDNEDFFLAGRVPVGLQLMVSPKIETFAELAPGLQVLNDVDFYWAGCVGVRFLLGK
jgi:hypothetical protein